MTTKQPLLANLNIRGLRDALFSDKFTGDISGWKFWPTKTDERGMLICEDLGKTLEFQFNPTSLSVNKKQVYENRSYPGRMHTEPIWINGEPREISFDLTFDASGGSAYTKIGLFTEDSGKFSSDTQLSANRNSIPEQIDSLDNKAFKGTLPIIETLESFTYPMLKDKNRPRFIYGVAVFSEDDRFLPPPTVIFTFGLLYMECKVSIQYKHTLFNRNLVPIRSEVQVTLNILEGIIKNDS